LSLNQREREQGNEVVQELDKDLMKRHDEIEALFEDLGFGWGKERGVVR
jgi:hypothetical protein